jgi:hypothetical protein
VPPLGYWRQYFVDLLLTAQAAATGDGARSKIGQDRNEVFGVLSTADQADEPPPGQSETFGKGLFALMRASQMAEVDSGMPFDSGQYGKKAVLKLDHGRLEKNGRCAHEDLLREAVPVQGRSRRG